MNDSGAAWFAGKTHAGHVSLVLALVVCCFAAPRMAVGALTVTYGNNVLTITIDGADDLAVSCSENGYVTINGSIYTGDPRGPIKANEVRGIVINAANGLANDINVSGVTEERFPEMEAGSLVINGDEDLDDLWAPYSDQALVTACCLAMAAPLLALMVFMAMTLTHRRR